MQSPLTPQQRDILIRTIAGESGGEGPLGWASVANVIRNRTQDPRWPSDPQQVALQPKQFSAWNQGAGGNSIPYSITPNDPHYQAIGNIVDAVYNGAIPDPTQGAVFYYAPRGMANGTVPPWLAAASQEGAPRQIGNHVFAGQAGGGQSASMPNFMPPQQPDMAALIPAFQSAASSQPYMPTGTPGSQGNNIVSGPSGTFLADPAGKTYTSLTTGRTFPISSG